MTRAQLVLSFAVLVEAAMLLKEHALIDTYLEAATDDQLSKVRRCRWSSTPLTQTCMLCVAVSARRARAPTSRGDRAPARQARRWRRPWAGPGNILRLALRRQFEIRCECCRVIKVRPMRQVLKAPLTVPFDHLLLSPSALDALGTDAQVAVRDVHARFAEVNCRAAHFVFSLRYVAYTHKNCVPSL